MIIDCDTCTVRGPSCGDCMVTALLGPPPEHAARERPDPQEAERAAVATLSASGLLPCPVEVRCSDEQAPGPRGGGHGTVLVVVNLLPSGAGEGPSPDREDGWLSSYEDPYPARHDEGHRAG